MAAAAAAPQFAAPAGGAAADLAAGGALPHGLAGGRGGRLAVELLQALHTTQESRGRERVRGLGWSGGEQDTAGGVCLRRDVLAILLPAHGGLVLLVQGARTIRQVAVVTPALALVAAAATRGVGRGGSGGGEGFLGLEGGQGGRGLQRRLGAGLEGGEELRNAGAVAGAASAVATHGQRRRVREEEGGQWGMGVDKRGGGGRGRRRTMVVVVVVVGGGGGLVREGGEGGQGGVGRG